MGIISVSPWYWKPGRGYYLPDPFFPFRRVRARARRHQRMARKIERLHRK